MTDNNRNDYVSSNCLILLDAGKTKKLPGVLNFK